MVARDVVGSKNLWLPASVLMFRLCVITNPCMSTMVTSLAAWACSNGFCWDSPTDGKGPQTLSCFVECEG